MKIYILLFLVVVIATIISAAPYELSSTGEFEPLEEIAVEPLEKRIIRRKREACNFLRGGLLGDAACISTCLVKNKVGGYCDSNNVCICAEKTVTGILNGILEAIFK